METQPETIEYLIQLKHTELTFTPESSGQERRAKRKEYATQLFQIAKEKLAQYPEIKILDELSIAYTLLAQSTKDEFEKFYGITLSYETFTVPNLNTGAREESDWRMHGTPKVPAGLEDIILGISLNQKVFLTD